MESLLKNLCSHSTFVLTVLVTAVVMCTLVEVQLRVGVWALSLQVAQEELLFKHSLNTFMSGI